jgi:hypothetical protein
MAKRKLDGIIEAVRYAADGNIYFVRAYERRGVVWSDQVLLKRKELVEQLALGRQFVTGERESLLGSVFTTGSAIRQVDGKITSGGQVSSHDFLAGVPVF